MPGVSGEDEDPLDRDAMRRADLLARVYSLDEMLAQETEEAEPLLGNFLRKGQVTLLGGHGGQGKTTTGYHMMRAAVTGKEFLGARGEGTTALAIDFEQGVGVAQRAVMRAFYPSGYQEGVPVADLIRDYSLGEEAKRIWYADWREGASMEGWEVMFEVIGHLVADKQPDLVLLDPIYKLFLGANVNEGEVVGRLIGYVDEIRRHNPLVSWLIPMHPRKPPMMGEKVPGMMDLYGSMYWSAWAGQIFTIHRTTGNGATFRICKDRMGAMTLEDWTVSLDPMKGYKRAIGDIGADGPRTPEEKIHRILQEVQPQKLNRKEIGDLLELHPKAVIRATKKIEEQMLKGRYRGVVIDEGANNTKFYGYEPTSEGDRVIDEIKRAFDAEEDD
jgi:hypothetical protein